MQNLIASLKSEITRIARKEARSEIDSLKKAVSQHRSDIASLKRKLVEVERLKKQSIRSAKSAAQESATLEPEKLRFRPQGLASHRKRLGLSAQAMGQLLGVSGQSVAAWESGKTQPKRSQLLKIAEVRKMGKRDLAARLTQS